MDQFRSASPLDHPVVAAATTRTLRRALRSALPAFADFALVHLRAGGLLVAAATAHVHPHGGRILRELTRIHRVSVTDSGSAVAQVVKTGRPLIRSDIRLDEGDATNRVAVLHRRLGPRSALVVPILGAGRAIGALSLCYAHSGRRYTGDALPAARGLAVAIACLLGGQEPHAAVGLPAAARHARQGTTIRRRLAARD